MRNTIWNSKIMGISKILVLKYYSFYSFYALLTSCREAIAIAEQLWKSVLAVIFNQNNFNAKVSINRNQCGAKVSIASFKHRLRSIYLSKTLVLVSYCLRKWSALKQRTLLYVHHCFVDLVKWILARPVARQQDWSLKMSQNLYQTFYHKLTSATYLLM